MYFTHQSFTSISDCCSRSSYDTSPVVHLASYGWVGNVCPDGHKCFRSTFNKIRFCDSCAKEIPKGASGQRCKMCAFDLCEECCLKNFNYAAEVFEVVITPSQPSPGLLPSSPAPPPTSTDTTKPPHRVPGPLPSSPAPPPTSTNTPKPSQRAPCPSVFPRSTCQTQLSLLQCFGVPFRPIVCAASVLPPQESGKLNCNLTLASSIENGLVLSSEATLPTIPLPPTAVSQPPSTTDAAEKNLMILNTVPLLSLLSASTQRLIPQAVLPPQEPTRLQRSRLKKKPGPSSNQMKLNFQYNPTCNPHSSPTAATESSLSEAGAATLPPPVSAAGPETRASSTASASKTASAPVCISSSDEATGEPDSPVSKWEAFNKLMEQNPDKKFSISLGIQCAIPGVSVAIQCSSPDPLFVDLRVPRPYMDCTEYYGIPIGCPTPKHPPFGRRPETFEYIHITKALTGVRGRAEDIEACKYKIATVYIQNAQVIRQPRDGSCLYHALIHGTGHTGSVMQLRRELVDFVRTNYKLEVHGYSLETWIRWECLCRYVGALLYISTVNGYTDAHDDMPFSVEQYAKKMITDGAWGGGIELCCFSRSRKLNVHVYRVSFESLLTPH